MASAATGMGTGRREAPARCRVRLSPARPGAGAAAVTAAGTHRRLFRHTGDLPPPGPRRAQTSHCHLHVLPACATLLRTRCPWHIHPHPDPTPHSSPPPALSVQISLHSSAPTPRMGPLRPPHSQLQPGIYCPEHRQEAKSRGGERHGGVTHRPGLAVTATPAVTPEPCHAEPCPARCLCPLHPAQKDLGEGTAPSLLSFPSDPNTGGDTLLYSGTYHPSSDVPHPRLDVPKTLSPPVGALFCHPKTLVGVNWCFWCGVQGGMWSHVCCPLPSPHLSPGSPGSHSGYQPVQEGSGEYKVMAQTPNSKFSPRADAGKVRGEGFSC